MNWQRHLCEMTLAGGALVAAACCSDGPMLLPPASDDCNCAPDMPVSEAGAPVSEAVSPVADAEPEAAAETGPGGYSTLCPVFNGQPTCPAASDANGCDLALGNNCAASALPQGVVCSGMSQCQARIGPVDGCGRVDGYICSCIDGR